MKYNFILLYFLIIGVFCIFDEEIQMDKSQEGSGLLLRRFDENTFLISNSLTSYLFNIRNGEKKDFEGIIPLDSSIYEPFVLFVNNQASYIVDAYSNNEFIKIYDIKNNKYKAYTGLKINKNHKRKFCKLEIANDNKFIVANQDINNNLLEIRVVTSNGTEVFRSQKVDTTGSDDFYVYTQTSGSHKSIIVIVFYEGHFIDHQWYRNGNGQVYYSTNKADSNQFIKQGNVQMSTNGIFCGLENGDVNCHRIIVNYNAGFTTKVFNIQMLQRCKSTFKLNVFNKEKYAVSCLNTKNEYIIQLFDVNLKRDFDMNGIILFRDEENDKFDYDILQGKENELVIFRADLPNNKYYLEAFNFIKNANNLYQLCPDGCQDCYFAKELGIRYQNNSYIEDIALNCSLCKFNRYFADDFGDICFSIKNRPAGYDFIEQYRKFASCVYCAKTGPIDDICYACLNSKKYDYFIDDPSNGGGDQICKDGYEFNRFDKKVCISSYNRTSNYNSHNSFRNLNSNNTGNGVYGTNSTNNNK